MTDTLFLHILLVEDDKDNLALLNESLPDNLEQCQLRYDPCVSFEEAENKLPWQRYDMVLTDIFMGPNKTEDEDAKAKNIIQKIREKRFCPIIAFTDGSHPLSITQMEGPFTILVDKSPGNDQIIDAMKNLLKKGLPQIARRLHDELDQLAGPRYLWDFMEKNWEELEKINQTSHGIIERLIRRRASILLGRLDPLCDDVQEVAYVSAADYYLIPPISNTFRLGHVLRQKSDKRIFVVLTPHCHLEVQSGASSPRAENVMLISTFPAEEIISKIHKKSPFTGNDDVVRENVRRHIQSPMEKGQPRGRYWFLPGFLFSRDLYCDFLCVQSIPYDTVYSDYEPLAVLDTPYAEALQSCFTSFYQSVGLPNLNPDHFSHLATMEKTDDKCP